MKRIVSAIVALVLLVGTVVVTTPTNKAQATVTWPIGYGDVYGGGVAVFGEDDMAIMYCSDRSDTLTALLIKDGEVHSSLPDYGSSGYMCDTTSGFTAKDGTFYATKTTSAGTAVVAYRYGRQLWATEIGYPSNCAQNGSSSNKAYAGMFSIGADGNLYAYVVSDRRPTTCEDKLYGFDVNDGSFVFTPVTLSAPPGTGLGYSPSATRLWTYDSKIVLVDRNAVLREFEYDGDAITTYTFPRPTNHSVYWVSANANGTVFAATRPPTPWDDGVIMFREDDADTGTITTPGDSFNSPQLTVSPGGDITAVFWGSIRRYDAVNDTYSTVPLNSISGFSGGDIVRYIEDSSGNGLVVRSLFNSGNSARGVSVDLVAAGTGTITNLFFMSGTTDPGTNPSLSPYFPIWDGLYDGYLYLPICEEGWDCHALETAPMIHKIAVTGFGTPLRDDYKRNAYESGEREYVAMGDSFSSGEGVPPFILESDYEDTNECHRSSGAYAVALDADPAMDLHLVDFVACSGATTTNILDDGQWNEPAQINALSENTDVVTLTLGGNDVGFREYAHGCAVNNWCAPEEGGYNDMMEAIEGSLEADLEEVYQEILDRAENATLYVGGYPHLVDPFSNCVSFGWADDYGVAEVISELNDRIREAVNDVEALPGNSDRVIYIEPNLPGSPFEDHYLCSTTPYFNNVIVPNPEYSYHPNQGGQAAYEELFGNELD